LPPSAGEFSFEVADADGDGIISMAEWRAVMEAYSEFQVGRPHPNPNQA
jgi:hypothetical protein